VESGPLILHSIALRSRPGTGTGHHLIFLPSFLPSLLPSLPPYFLTYLLTYLLAIT